MLLKAGILPGAPHRPRVLPHGDLIWPPVRESFTLIPWRCLIKGLLNTFEKLHFCQTGAVTNWNMKTVNKGSVSAIWWCSKALPPLPGNQTTRSVWHGVPALLSTVNNRCWHFKLTFNSSEPAHYFWLVGYTEKTNNKSGRHNFHISHWKQSMEKSLENDDPWNYLTPWGFLLISYEVHMCCEALERNTKHLYSSVL